MFAAILAQILIFTSVEPSVTYITEAPVNEDSVFITISPALTPLEIVDMLGFDDSITVEALGSVTD